MRLSNFQGLRQAFCVASNPAAADRTGGRRYGKLPGKSSRQRTCDCVFRDEKAEEDAPVYAYFDKKWSMEALGNILDNAIKYTNTGGITIKLCSYELFACVEVTDTGIGIGEEEHAAVFGRFYRGNAVAEKSGVGIGLYLARSIMQQQGGYIRLSSTPGEGSTFGLYFPTAIVSKL